MTEETLEFHIKEHYDILLKTTRRCVRDLGHLIDYIKDDSPITKEELQARISTYQVLLGGTHEYLTSMHYEIRNLEIKLQCEMNENQRLREEIARLTK